MLFVSSCLVSRLLSRLISNIRKYQYTTLTLLRRDRETRVPAYEHLTLPTGQRYLFQNNIVGARCTLKTTVCTVTATRVAGRVTVITKSNWIKYYRPLLLCSTVSLSWLTMAVMICYFYGVGTCWWRRWSGVAGNVRRPFDVAEHRLGVPRLRRRIHLRVCRQPSDAQLSANDQPAWRGSATDDTWIYADKSVTKSYICRLC